MEDCIKNDLKDLIREATKTLDRSTFVQEPTYTAALFGRLHKREIWSPSGQFLKIEGVPSTDRGYGSAEKSSGIDIGLVLTWEDEIGNCDRKAVLIQAKNDVLSIRGTTNAAENLASQSRKMLAISQNSVVMECPVDSSEPQIFEAIGVPPGWSPPPMSLSDFLVDQVLSCKFGDFEGNVVAIALSANRTLHISTNAPIPRNKPAWRRH